jgi:hypothetical protein
MLTQDGALHELRDLLIAHLCSFGYAVDPALSPDEVITTYFNVKRRRIEPRPRTVAWSRELRAKVLNPTLAAVARAIESAAAKGS